MVPIWPLSGYNHYINCDFMRHENCLLGMWLATTTISRETQETKIRLVINHEKLGFNVIEPLNIGIFHGISYGDSTGILGIEMDINNKYGIKSELIYLK